MACTIAHRIPRLRSRTQDFSITSTRKLRITPHEPRPHVLVRAEAGLDFPSTSISWLRIGALRLSGSPAHTNHPSWRPRRIRSPPLRPSTIARRSRITAGARPSPSPLALTSPLRARRALSSTWPLSHYPPSQVRISSNLPSRTRSALLALLAHGTWQLCLFPFSATPGQPHASPFGPTDLVPEHHLLRPAGSVSGGTSPLPGKARGLRRDNVK